MVPATEAYTCWHTSWAEALLQRVGESASQDVGEPHQALVSSDCVFFQQAAASMRRRPCLASSMNSLPLLLFDEVPSGSKFQLTRKRLWPPAHPQSRNRPQQVQAKGVLHAMEVQRREVRSRNGRFGGVQAST